MDRQNQYNGFNRTFMELKYVLPNLLGNIPLVLIVPLWN